METIIRSATEEDLEALTVLGKITFREAYEEQNTVTDMDHYVETYLNEAYTLSDLRDPNTVFYLAFSADQLVGYVKLKKMPEDLLGNKGPVLELKRIYVLRAHYGKGFAQLLMRETEKHAAEKQLSCINLAVWKENARAIAFYHKAGFTIAGETTFDWGTGKIDIDWVMKKEA